VLEDALKNANEKCGLLEEQLQQSRERADLCERVAIVFSKGVNKISPLLDEMRESAKLLTDGWLPRNDSGGRISGR